MNDDELLYRLERLEFMAGEMVKTYSEVSEGYFAPGAERDAYREGLRDGFKEMAFIIQTNFPEAMKVINEVRKNG